MAKQELIDERMMIAELKDDIRNEAIRRYCLHSECYLLYFLEEELLDYSDFVEDFQKFLAKNDTICECNGVVLDLFSKISNCCNCELKLHGFMLDDTSKFKTNLKFILDLNDINYSNIPILIQESSLFHCKGHTSSFVSYKSWCELYKSCPPSSEK